MSKPQHIILCLFKHGCEIYSFSRLFSEKAPIYNFYVCVQQQALPLHLLISRTELDNQGIVCGNSVQTQRKLHRVAEGTASSFLRSCAFIFVQKGHSGSCGGKDILGSERSHHAKYWKLSEFLKKLPLVNGF